MKASICIFLLAPKFFSPMCKDWGAACICLGTFALVSRAAASPPPIRACLELGRQTKAHTGFQHMLNCTKNRDVPPISSSLELIANDYSTFWKSPP